MQCAKNMLKRGAIKGNRQDRARYSDVAMGRWGGGHPPIGGLWAPVCRRSQRVVVWQGLWEASGKEGSNVALSGTSRQQVIYNKAGYRTETWTSQNYGTLSTLAKILSDLRWIISDLIGTPKVRIKPYKVRHAFT